MRFRCPFCQGIVSVGNEDMGIDCQCGHCGEIVTAPISRVATGAVIADFIILEELGRGGMGIVYLAHQITLDRPAALKILAEQYAGNPEFVVDFIKEARAAAKLNHPHIVQAYAVGEDEGIFFFAMEHIDGETMKDYMKREGVVPVDFAVMVVQQIAEALDYAWKEQRLIHRDIKPDNIMLTRKGRAKLADLGLARVAGDIDDADSDEVMGTPQYISPEHLTGDEMDVRSDIYSLGATLFHFVTGRFAFEGRTATEIARKHLEEPLTPPRKVNPNVPESVSKIVTKMMAKNPAERYQSAEALAEDLRLARQGKPTSAGGGGGGKHGKQFSMKKGGKTLTMRAASSTGTHKVVSASGTHSKLTASSSDIHLSKEELKAERERKAKVQIITLLGICATVMLGVGAYLLWWFSADHKAKPATTPKPVAVQPVATPAQPAAPAQPKSTEYSVQAEKLLAFVKRNLKSPANILVKVDEFLRNHSAPTYDCEKKVFDEIMRIYIPLDEKRVEKARQMARRKYLAIIKKREEAIRLKQEEELRKQREKERKEKEKQLAEQRAQQEKERREEYKKELAKTKDSMRYRSVYQARLGEWPAAVAVFDQAIKEPSLVPESRKDIAKEFAAWGKKMKKHMELAAKLNDAMMNAGSKLNGLQLEVSRGVLGKITKISGGKVTVRTFDGKLASAPILSLLLPQLRRLVNAAASKLLDDSSAAFHYFMATGRFVSAKTIQPDDWKQELSDSIQAYLKEKLKHIDALSAKRKAQVLQDLMLRCGRAELNKAYKAMQEGAGAE